MSSFGQQKLPANLLLNKAGMWYCVLTQMANGSGKAVFRFKELSSEFGVPERTLRSWHQKAISEGFIRSSNSYGGTVVVRLKARAKVLALSQITEMRNIAFVSIDLGPEFFSSAKKLAYKAIAAKRQAVCKSLHKRKKQDFKYFEALSVNCSNEAAVKDPRGLKVAGFVFTIGATHEAIASALQTSVASAQRNLKGFGIRVFQGFEPAKGSGLVKKDLDGKKKGHRPMFNLAGEQIPYAFKLRGQWFRPRPTFYQFADVELRLGNGTSRQIRKFNKMTREEKAEWLAA